MKGRKATPTHLKLVAGNPGKRPLNAREPQPRRERPSAPAHISEAAREVWGQAVMILDEMGVLTRADVFAVEILCEAMADHRAAGETIRACAATHREQAERHRGDPEAPLPDFTADGRYYRTINASGGVMWRTHPSVALRSDADRRIRGWCAEFGLSPSARSRIETHEADQGQRDKASNYFTA
jgi:P27 family predicted phage terminase small subunit